MPISNAGPWMMTKRRSRHEPQNSKHLLLKLLPIQIGHSDRFHHMVYHVLTPLRRYENLEKLIAMLQPEGVQWHVIMDEDAPFRLFFRQPWIHAYYQHNPEGEFWARCNFALNRWLDTHPLVDDDRYCILNDDDAYEPGFFQKISQHEGGLVIASMLRGQHTPVGVHPTRAHGTGTLHAAPEYMHAGLVGIEQAIVCGKWLREARLPLHPSGDGSMIEWLVNTHGAVYAPECFVHFNKYEPGRWD